MKNVGDNVRKSLLKRQVALENFKARKQTFLLERETILREIEASRTIWEKTIEQLPDSGFNL